MPSSAAVAPYEGAVSLATQAWAPPTGAGVAAAPLPSPPPGDRPRTRTASLPAAGPGRDALPLSTLSPPASPVAQTGAGGAAHGPSPAPGSGHAVGDATAASGSAARPGRAKPDGQPAAAAPAAVGQWVPLNAGPIAATILPEAAAFSAQLQPSVLAGGEHAAQAAAPLADSLAAAATLAPAQLSQAVTSLQIRPDGSSHLTVALNPAELGQVQVHIARAADGTARIEVAVERPETLRALQADVTHLHLALDRAGIAEQRSLTLHLSPPATAAGDPRMDAGGFAGGSQGSFQGGNRERGGWQAQPGAGGGQDFVMNPFPPDRATSRANRVAGLNITA